MPALLSQLRPVSLLAVMFTTLYGCALPETKPLLQPPPVVDPAQSATLNFKGTLQTGNVKHHHLIELNNRRVLRLDETVQQINVPAGPHMIKLTCHTETDRPGSRSGINFGLADDETSMEIAVEAGDTLCFKASTWFTGCAKLEQQDISECS